MTYMLWFQKTVPCIRLDWSSSHKGNRLVAISLILYRLIESLVTRETGCSYFTHIVPMFVLNTYMMARLSFILRYDF